MDRNTVIGFVLLLALAGGYFWWGNKQQTAFNEQKIADSIAAAKKTIHSDAVTQPLNATADTNINTVTSSGADSALAPAFGSSQSEMVTLSNGLLTIQFNTKGAVPQVIQLDSFKTYEAYTGKKDEKLLFARGEANQFNITLPFEGKNIETKELLFTPTLSTGSDGVSQLELKADLGNGKAVIYAYYLPKGSYVMQAKLRIIGMGQDLKSASSLPLTWTTEALRTEKDLKNERQYTQVHYLFADGEHDYHTIRQTNQKTLESPLKWMSLKTHFFNSTIIADDKFNNGSFSGVISETDSSEILTHTNKLSIPIQAGNDISFGYRWMIGPNDYNLLKSYNLDLEEMIPLGTGLFFFVKYISKWVVIPLFNLLNHSIVSMGIVIMLLTFIIRLCLSFFTYKSYLSSAKMRVLKPEIDQLREKYKDNQQQIGMEQMKLYRAAGVNPLGGCLPMLIQMPFLLAMYYFFPTAIQLRQAKFAWAEDLSTFDSIASWTQNIPFLSSVYGNHISLFTLLMTITSLILALYNKNMTNPAGSAGGNEMNMAMLKWMPFIMPILFLGWFNSFAAGLTFYYTFSNIISIVQQFVIQKFIINEKSILAKIEKKRSEPPKQSKWQERLEQMQKMQAERVKQQQKKK